MRIFLLLAFWSTQFISEAKTIKVLFIGNSYTYVNNLPQLLADLALSGGDTIIFDSNTPGGYTLQLHSTNSATLSKINSQQWDYVILQEQSQLPSFDPSQVETEVYPYARMLDSLIHVNNACTQTVFYMTWGRQNGDASNCSAYPPVCTYQGMQQRLRESYLQMAFDNHAIVAPVGISWKHIREQYPSLNLYQTDGSHPSLQGSYLAACTFYSGIFRKASLGLPFISSLSASDASILQNIASSTVLDSMSTWNTKVYLPVANFNITYLTSNSLFFQNTSGNLTDYIWDFGDGTTSHAQDPNHVYSANGNYQVVLTVNNDCFTLSDTQSVSININNIKNAEKENEVILIPNPAHDLVFVKGRNIRELRLFDIKGTELLIEKSEIIDISGFNAGIYFMKVFTDNCVMVKRIVKE